MNPPPKALRPIDLARAAGISTQHVRNLTDARVLPTAPRTASGYRTYTPSHRRALLAYQALVAGHGSPTARAVMQAVHADDLPQALALIDASHAALHDQRLSLRAAGEALEAIADQTPDSQPIPQVGMRIGQAAGHLGVRPSTLRVWESAGLLSPDREPHTRYRRLSATDIRDARMIHTLRQSHYLLGQIQPILEGLRRTGTSDALRAAISQRHTDLTERATAMLHGSSQLHDYLDSEEKNPSA